MSGSAPTRRKKRGPGHPSKCTPERTEKIFQIVRAGGTYRTACLAAGIDEKTFQNWRNRAQEPDAPAKYVRFFRALKQAEHEGEAARIAGIMKAGRSDWRALAWIQERRNPEEWSLKFMIEHSFSRSPFEGLDGLVQTLGPGEDAPLCIDAPEDPEPEEAEPECPEPEDKSPRSE